MKWSTILSESWAFYSYAGPRWKGSKRGGEVVAIKPHRASVCESQATDHEQCFGEFWGDTEKEACARAQVAGLAKRALSILILEHYGTEEQRAEAKTAAMIMRTELYADIDALEETTDL